MAPHVPVAALLAFIAHAALVHARTSVPAAAPAPRAAPQQLISLSTLFAAEAPPACIRDTPSSRWAVVAAAKDRSKPTVFCYGSRAQKCYRRATCCAWYKNQQECLAALPEARDNREGTYKEQLQCGKQLCAANGKSGFDVPGAKTWCEKGWMQFYGDMPLPKCSCVNKVGKGPQKICTRDPE